MFSLMNSRRAHDLMNDLMNSHVCMICTRLCASDWEGVLMIPKQSDVHDLHNENGPRIFSLSIRALMRSAPLTYRYTNININIKLNINIS